MTGMFAWSCCLVVAMAMVAAMAVFDG